jgi:hypothetical protein
MLESICRNLCRHNIIGAKQFHFFCKTGDNFGKSRGFGRRDPFNGKTFGVDAGFFKNDSDGCGSGQSFFITFQVMAFSDVSSHNDNAVSAL